MRAKNRKKDLRKGSLFRHYFTTTVAIVLVAMILFGSAMIILTASQWWNDKTDALTRNADVIVGRLKTMDFDNRFDDDPEMDAFIDIMTTVASTTTSDFFLTDLQGRVLICGDRGRIRAPSDCESHGNFVVPQKYLDRAVDGGFADYITNDEAFGRGKFVVAVPVVVDGKTQGIMFAVEDVFEGLVPHVQTIIQTSFYFFIAALIVTFISTYIFTRNVTRPLDEMQEVTKHFAKGEFEHRAKEDYDRAYLNEFSAALNQMADDLAIEEEAQRSFIANVSHELKTPMTTIGGFIDGILDGTIPQDRARDYLTVVSKEVRRLSRMVVSMLNLSKIETGEVSISPEDYDVVAQLFETLLPFERSIEEKRIVIAGFENLKSVTIHADRDLLQQVIYNLVDNAVKFTPEDGTITFFAEQTPDATVVSIRNTGAGVSQEELSRIFERFYKVDKSRSFDVKGVGLGLYIVKTIIKMHDGEIHATGKEGEYIEFSFRIPKN